MPKLEAGFRSQDGKVQGTGVIHDAEALPSDFIVKDEGFVDSNGHFVTREEALAQVDIKKHLSKYKFEGPELDGSQYRITAHNETGHQIGEFTFAATAHSNQRHPHYGYHPVGGADVHPSHRGKGVYGKMLQLGALFVKHKLKSKGLVSEGATRSDAATGAWDKLAQKNKVQQVRGVEDPNVPDFRLSEKESDPDKEDHEFLVALRRWLKNALKLKKSDDVHSLLHSSPRAALDDDHRIAVSMMGAVVEDIPEFAAAAFMANYRKVKKEDLRSALLAWEQDLEMAALYAYDLPRTEENRKALRAIMEFQSLDKAELEVAAIPRIIKAVLPEGEEFAKAIERAYAAHAVHAVSLGGKHSKGTAIAVDPKTHRKFLLKPGSGPTSPSAGVDEQTANQSRREVAFYKCAKAIGLEKWLPEAELLSLDGYEVAVMELVPTDFKDFNKKKREPGFQPGRALEKYRKDGTLFKWAMMDAMLGNPDRNFGNIMINDKDDIRLIDHGTSFAGFGFAPAVDESSFIPCYLRAWVKNNFSILDPEERLKMMPRADPATIAEFARWVDSFSEPYLAKIMSDYDILHDAVIARLHTVRTARPELRLETVLEFWAGVVSVSD